LADHTPESVEPRVDARGLRGPAVRAARKLAFNVPLDASFEFQSRPL
jgi:hypothetical protein